ncbi:VWA domain-containing protein [Pelagibius sp. Alg239-R121]|uniref:VWA domain-containing protein n=1 Tax=Pelagibius sp. Alg239-R121 TaxID=2993448 RepID=UPI0024A70DB6|nr:VWA domain-containing protein [Pelagibius sp. Alg239-R121]
MDQPSVPFSTIVYALREAGLEISVQDVMRGIEALEVLDDPFGQLAAVEPMVGVDAAFDRERLARRDSLVWLVQTLWARSDDERAIVRTVIEQAIAPAPGVHTLELRGPSSSQLVESEPTTRPPTSEPLVDLSITDGADEERTETMEEAAGLDGLSLARRKARAALSVPVPAIEDTGLGEATSFDLEDAPMIDELSLASVWRRFRQPVLKTDPTRVDIDRSVKATIRASGQLTIVPAERRVNQARLLVLLDVSAAMAPWTTTRAQFEATLDPLESRLEEVQIWYFSGVPGTRIARDTALRDREELTKLLQTWQGGPMLVLGEAGAARAPAPQLYQRMLQFVGITRMAAIRPVIWVNPMPRHRWQADVAHLLDREAHITAFPLGYESLIEAVRVMREQAK